MKTEDIGVCDFEQNVTAVRASIWAYRAEAAPGGEHAGVRHCVRGRKILCPAKERDEIARRAESFLGVLRDVWGWQFIRLCRTISL